MSGFAAYVSADAALSRGQLDALAAGIAHRGRDRDSARTIGSCTLLHSALWTTREAEREDYPVHHASADVWLVADARIDNREDLVEQLTGTVEHPLDTDADLILAAYEHWGAECPSHLVGDFAFAVWDGPRRELFVARDPFAVRPAFYSVVDGALVVASTLPAVLSAAGGPGRIDHAYLDAYVLDRPPMDGTPWTGVHRLTPGHTLRWDGRRAVTERYWDPVTAPLEQPLQTSVDQVRSAFDEAVRCRLRTRDGVTVEVSGGLDSSTIAATAVGLGADVTAVAIAFPDPEAAELPYVGALADALGVDVHVLDAEAAPLLDTAQEVRAHREPLYGVDASDTAARHDAAAAFGCSVVLSGVGGDEALYGSGDVGVLDLATRGRIVAALRWGRRERSWPGMLGWLPKAVLRDVAGRVVRARVGRRPGGWLARTDRRRRQRAFARAHDWFSGEPPSSAITGRPPAASRAAAERRDYYVRTEYNPPAYEQTDRIAAERHVEVRYPYLDRRLVELVLRLPEEHIRIDGVHRGLHRLAFGARLPSDLAARTDKGDLTQAFVRKMMREVPRDRAVTLLSRLPATVDRQAMLATYDAGAAAFQRPEGAPHGLNLWLALSVGMLLEQQST